MKKFEWVLPSLIGGTAAGLFMFLGANLALNSIDEKPLDLCDERLLELVAPEMLVAPVYDDFINPEYYATDEAYMNAIANYNNAVNQYIANGTWATLEDGTRCSIYDKAMKMEHVAEDRPAKKHFIRRWTASPNHIR